MPSPSPNDLTRQQLDELDALLQRMLSVPGPPSAAPVPVPSFPPSLSGWRADPPASVARAPYVTEEPIEAPAFAGVTVAAEAQVAMPTRPRPPMANAVVELPPPEAPTRVFGPASIAEVGPAANITPTPGTLRGVDAPALPANFKPAVYDEPIPEPTPAPPEPKEIDAIPLTVAEESADVGESEEEYEEEEGEDSPIPVFLWPLYAANWVLEMVFGLMGPIGWIVLYPPVKVALGIAGFLAMIGAAAWSAHGKGWITLPILK